VTIRLLILLALSASAAVGVGVGVLVSQVTETGDERRDVRSITGVSSGTDGTKAKDKDAEKKGVAPVTVLPETRTTTDPSQETHADRDNASLQTVDIERVKGTAGTTTEAENTIEIFTTNTGAMQSIRGIKGIDTVMLQNLEAVLRMQAPPPPPEGGGSVRTAAALLTMADDGPAGPEVETDDRQELSEFELEGS
jgi:hypothetical protein